MGDEVRARVASLLKNNKWLGALQTNFSTGGGEKFRVDMKRVNELLRQNELPECVFVAASELEALPKIPRSDDKQRLTPAEKINPLDSVVFFVSHRWFGGTPDTEEGDKAKTLLRFATWWAEYDHMKLKRKDDPLKVYFWIDYSCIDQTSKETKAKGIATLPLYVSSCGGLVQIMEKGDPTDEYYSRSWCNLETILAYRFQIAGAAPFIVPLNWSFEEIEKERRDEMLTYGMAKGSLKEYARSYVHQDSRTLYDPFFGGDDLSKHLTFLEDADYIANLLEIAKDHRLKFLERKENSYGLQFGKTKVEARVMTKLQ